jgi:hypothetical protein
VKKGIGGHHWPYHGRANDWLTPQWILTALGPFDLDPCAPVTRPWDTAKQHYTIEDDGLTQPWRGRVWLNPPYGPDTKRWLARLAAHGNGIALTFARTETEMFFDHVWSRADAVFFFQGRLHFCYPDGTRSPGNAGGPSVLIAYGASNARALRHLEDRGKLIDLNASAATGKELT